MTLECAGYKDFAVYFKESDLRQSQTYGPIGKAWLDEAFESFGPFNHTSAKIEWRLYAGGAPFATIVRWFVSDPEMTSDTDTRYGEILVVSTVATAGNPTSCVVGYVDALENGGANALARTLADGKAASFTCGKDEPQWQGERGAWQANRCATCREPRRNSPQGQTKPIFFSSFSPKFSMPSAMSHPPDERKKR